MSGALGVFSFRETSIAAAYLAKALLFDKKIANIAYIFLFFLFFFLLFFFTKIIISRIAFLYLVPHAYYSSRRDFNDEKEELNNAIANEYKKLTCDSPQAKKAFISLLQKFPFYGTWFTNVTVLFF